MSTRFTVAALAAALSAGCAFFGKTEPLDARYFSAELMVAETTVTPEPASRVPLRLGEVSSANYLRERIAYRRSERELGFYEGKRWTERPESYLRRALAHALFEQRGMQRVSSGVAPTLEVELTHFEEVIAPRHFVRVQARVVLRDQRTARFEHTFAAEHAVESGDFDEVANALASALGHCVDEISDRVVAELREHPVVPLAPLPQPAPRAD